MNFHVRPTSTALLVRISRWSVDAVLWAIGEPRRHEFAPGDPEALLTRSGWRVEATLEADHEPRHGFGLFVLAAPVT